MNRTDRILVGLGIVTWLAAAIFIRLALPNGWLDGGFATLLVFAVSVPIAAISIEIARNLAGASQRDLLRIASIISAVGLLLDGIAFVWASQLYTVDHSTLFSGGAWLLWTVGVTLTYALVRTAKGHDAQP